MENSDYDINIEIISSEQAVIAGDSEEQHSVKLNSYVYVDSDVVSHFKQWLDKIKEYYQTPEIALSRWKSDFDGGDPKTVIANLWHTSPILPASKTTFHSLDHLMNDSLIENDIQLSEQNLTVINEIGKKFCMLEIASRNDACDFWDIVSRCWGLKNGITLFLSAFSDLSSFHNWDNDTLVDTIFLSDSDRDILVFTYLAKRVGINVFSYNLMSANSCRFYYHHLGYNSESIVNGARQIPIVPGTAILTQYITEDSDDNDYVILGQYGMLKLFPFVCHSSSATVAMSNFVTIKYYYNFGRFDHQENVYENWCRMSSKEIIEQITAPIPDIHPHCDEMEIAGRLVKRPYFIFTKFHEMNAVAITKQHKHNLNKYGVVGFRAVDFNSVRPIFINQTPPITMNFAIQDVSQANGCNYIFHVDEKRSLDNVTIQQAQEMAVIKFREMKANDKIGDFIVLSNLHGSIRKDKGKLYLVSTQKDCPILSDWSNNTKMLVADENSSAQFINTSNTGLYTPSYTFSVANSITAVQSGYRGLNKAVCLLTGKKVWIVIPMEHYPRFFVWLESQTYKQDEEYCINWFTHSKILIDPSSIPSHFQVSLLVQEAGDLLVFDTHAIYWGWSITFNISYEWNFAGEGWERVQHFQPVCDFSEESCCRSQLSVKDLMSTRNNQFMMQMYNDDLYFNPYKRDWKLLLPRLQDASITSINNKRVTRTRKARNRK